MDDKLEALRRFKTSRLTAKMNEVRLARAEEADDTPTVAAGTEGIPVHGLAVPYDTPTGDGRQVRGGALVWDLEEEGIPIIWDPTDGDHTGMTLGRVDALRADGDGVHVEAARLFEFTDEDAAAAVARVVELIEENALGWSVMMDDEEIEETFSEPVMSEKDGAVTVRYKRSDSMMTVISGRIRHLAIVDTPAFPGARPVLGPAPALAAAAAIATYPASHFDMWESRDLVPLQVTSDGRVWGHAAGDGTFRGNPANGRYSPDPDPKMRNFHVGTVELDNGEVIRVGSLTSGSLHADTGLDLHGQRAYHEDTSTVWAKVRAWNDSRGRLCVAGSVVPGLDDTTLGQVAGTPLSVELWPVPGVGRTLVGAHTVPTPAWPVAASAKTSQFVG